MRVYGVVNSSTEDAPLIKREKQKKFATASKIALLTVGLAGGVIAIASGSSSMRLFGLGTPSALAEKCGDLSAIPQCPSAKLGSSEAEKLLDSVQCATSKAQVKMYATGPCAAWPEGHATQTKYVSKVGRKEMSSKKPSSGSVSGAVNDKTVVADTQKFNQNLQDDIDEAAQETQDAADNVTDVVQKGFQQVNNTWNEITGQGGEDDDEKDEDEEDSTPSSEDSGDSEDATPSSEDSGETESVKQAEAESASAEEEAKKEVEDAVNHVEGELTRMAEKIDAAEDEIDKSMTDIEKAQDAIDDAIDDEDDESHKPKHPSSTDEEQPPDESHKPKHPSSTDEEQPPPSEEEDTSAYGTTSKATV